MSLERMIIGVATVFARSLGRASMAAARGTAVTDSQRTVSRQQEAVKYLNSVNPAESEMTKKEAVPIQGMSPTAGKSEVQAAHRRVTTVNHPKKGGAPHGVDKIVEKTMWQRTI